MKYYFVKDEQQFGPFPLEELVRLINADTLVWRSGLESWVPARELEEVAQQLSTIGEEVPPPPPQGEQTPPAQPPLPPQGSPIWQVDQSKAFLPCPPDNMVWAILATLLCCLPLGIVAIIYASKVDKAYAAGNYQEAVSHSRNAVRYSIAAAIVSVVLGGLYFLLTVLGAIGGEGFYDRL